MKIFLGMIASVLVAGMSSPIWAQDATPTAPPAQSPQQDTSSPLTPTSPNTSSPLTPAPPNPVNQPQPATAAAVQSSSEPPATFVQPPIETNRVDPAAETSLSVEIDPASAEAALLNPDASGLAPTTAGLSLNSVQGTTSPTGSSSVGAFAAPPPVSADPYPTLISEPASTQAFLSALGRPSASRATSAPVGSSSTSTSMGPLIGSAAVNNSTAMETMSSTPIAIGSSTFMRSVGSSPTIRSFRPASIGTSAIGPTALRLSPIGSSSSFSGSHSHSSSHH